MPSSKIVVVWRCIPYCHDGTLVMPTALRLFSQSAGFHSRSSLPNRPSPTVNCSCTPPKLVMMDRCCKGSPLRNSKALLSRQLSVGRRRQAESTDLGGLRNDINRFELVRSHFQSRSQMLDRNVSRSQRRDMKTWNGVAESKPPGFDCSCRQYAIEPDGIPPRLA